MIDDPSVPMSYDPSSPMDDERTTPDGEGEAESGIGSSSDAQDTPSSEPEAEPETTPSTDSQETQRSEADSEPEMAPLIDSQDMPSSEPDPEHEAMPLADAQDTPSSEPDPEPETTPLTDAQDAPSSEPDFEPVPAPSTEALIAPSGESDADQTSAPESSTQAEVRAEPVAEAKAKSAGTAQSPAESVPGTESAVMPLMEHLIELRKRLTWAVLALLISTGISFIFAKQVLIFLIAPMGDAMPQALKPTESLGNYMKVALICGVTLAMPVIVYQIGRFLAPGLTKQEKRWLFVLVPGATLCFVVGAAFAYFVMLPRPSPSSGFHVRRGYEEAWPSASTCPLSLPSSL